MAYRILVINPGGASTKVALFEDEHKLVERKLEHSADELKRYPKIIDQLDMRVKAVEDFMRDEGIDSKSLSAVSARGGAFKPMPSGVYRVNEAVLKIVLEGRVMTEHASNLGVLIADRIARPLGIPAFFVDPVCVDEMEEPFRLSGHPLLPRVSLAHALNIKYVARIAAQRVGKRYEDMNMVITHLGTGISVTAHRKGRMIDVSNANDGGPFSPQRTGALPVTGLAKLCFSGKYTLDDVMRMLVKEGGIYAYLGTYSFKEVMERIDAGDKEAKLVYDAMLVQVAKEMGAMAAALGGQVDLQVVTGGIANEERFVKDLEKMVSFIGPFMVIPGEMEMEALAAGALRVLRGEEEAKEIS